MWALAHIGLGLVISATPVAAQPNRPAPQAAADSAPPQKDQAQKDPAKALSPEKPEKRVQPGQESLRPPIGPRTTQGLAEDAISRGNR
jgi:hypothetical protein